MLAHAASYYSRAVKTPKLTLLPSWDLPYLHLLPSSPSHQSFAPLLLRIWMTAMMRYERTLLCNSGLFIQDEVDIQPETTISNHAISDLHPPPPSESDGSITNATTHPSHIVNLEANDTPCTPVVRSCTPSSEADETLLCSVDPTSSSQGYGKVKSLDSPTVSACAAPSKDLLTAFAVELSPAATKKSHSSVSYPIPSDCFRQIVGLVLSFALVDQRSNIVPAVPSISQLDFPCDEQGTPILTQHIREDLLRIVQIETEIVTQRRAALDSLQRFLDGNKPTQSTQCKNSSTYLPGCEQFLCRNLEAEESWHLYMSAILSMTQRLTTCPIPAPSISSPSPSTVTERVPTLPVTSKHSIDGALADESASLDGDDEEETRRILRGLSKEAQAKALALQKKLKAMREQGRGCQLPKNDRQKNQDEDVYQRLLPVRDTGVRNMKCSSDSNTLPSTDRPTHRHQIPSVSPIRSVIKGDDLTEKVAKDFTPHDNLESKNYLITSTSFTKDRKRAAYEAWIAKRQYEKLVQANKHSVSPTDAKIEERVVGSTLFGPRFSSRRSCILLPPPSQSAERHTSNTLCADTGKESKRPVVRGSSLHSPVKASTPTTPNKTGTPRMTVFSTTVTTLTKPKTSAKAVVVSQKLPSPSKQVRVPMKNPLIPPANVTDEVGPWGPRVTRTRPLPPKENNSPRIPTRQTAVSKNTAGHFQRVPLRAVQNAASPSKIDHTARRSEVARCIQHLEWPCV